MERLDCVVIGAGVVGLAVARAMALAGREVVVLEASEAIGTGTSSRNSEVIHSGVYYPQHWRKADLCVRGRAALYAYCAEKHVGHRRCGKLIVASDDQQAGKLAQLHRQAIGNGVLDMEMLSGAQARALEPALVCHSALLSPSTGIVDSHGLMLALQGDAECAGAVIAFQSAVEGGEISADGICLRVADADWLATTVINCAGLTAQKVAASLRGLDPRFVPPTFYAKGNYFSYSGKPCFSRLIYPLPEAAGMGVHLTLDLAGRQRFGPDVEWITDIDYRVNPRRGDAFYAEIRKYWPGLPDGSLQPDYSGIRPKMGGASKAAMDFRIDDENVHGVRGLVNLFGMESPGLTSCLAIGDYVRELVAGR